MAEQKNSDIVDHIFEVLSEAGSAMYGGERVTQLAHALQCADLAMRSNASDALVTSALLHDYGHMLNDDDAVAAARGQDQFHEDVAANYLRGWFAPEVTEPIRMHVPAKRYLCAVDENYFAELSPASVRSLAVQGGKFSPQDAQLFIDQPFARAAVELRRWDDLAKDPTREVPGLKAYRTAVQNALR